MDQPFGDCKNDPLHKMGKVQRYGALIAFNAADHKAVFCSENTEDILGVEPGNVLGRPGLELFPDNWGKLADLAHRRGFHFLSSERFPTKLVAAVHQQGEKLILEVEPVESTGEHWWDHAERIEFLERLENTKTVADCRRLLVRYLFERIEFDRVMLYEFAPDMHGYVVEERLRAGADSFLGLHFPAEDIPPNAQRFYTENWQRLIADVNAEQVPVAGLSAAGETLDLTGAMLRAVHPVHLQYLKNMNVAASFSLSLLINGNLYGLLACHHNTPRVVNLADRLAYEEIARMLSSRMEGIVNVMERDRRVALGQQLAEINENLAQSYADATVSLAQHLGMMQQLVGADAAWLHFGGEDYYSGPVSERSTLAKLKDYFGSLGNSSVSSYDRVPEPIAADSAMCPRSCGAIHVPLTDENFVAFLRPELVQTITWAGRSEGGETESLTPRSSFEAWTQQMRGAAEPWTELDLEFAAKLQKVLLKHARQPTFE